MNIDKDYRNACYTRGVVRLVGAPVAPAVVDESIIETIQGRLNEVGVAPFQSVSFSPGDEVMVMDGPFAGLVGIFVKPMNGMERVSILLKTINVRVDVDTALVGLAGEH
jgi:transcription antitermination factor NusG